MRKMCVIPKQVLEDWRLKKECLVSPGAKLLLELACHIAGQGELSGYPVDGLVARLLPNGDIRVKTPEERMQWHVEDVPTSVEFAACGWWPGFFAGVGATLIVWFIREMVLLC